MRRNWTLAVVVLLAGIFWCDLAFAQSSLGLGRTETTVSMSGPLAPLLFWLKGQQTWFYELMRGQLLAMRSDATRVWALAGLSFAYGIFHAAGPGHGKAVISSYMIANEVAARRGIALSFASALVQALSAVALVGALTLFLRGAGLRQQDMTGWLESASYGAIALLGAWLLWSKVFGGGHAHSHAPAQRRDIAEARPHVQLHGEHDHGPDCDHEHEHGHDHEHAQDHHHHDDDDGHSHAPNPALLTGKVGLRQAWTAIVAVGLRPCSGALIVLTFAFLNSLYLAGLVSVFAMAIGTGVTVAALAALAVWAKDVAVRVGGAAERGALIHRVAEIAGAAVVFVLGVTLFSASLLA